jgi:hypothetical protein
MHVHARVVSVVRHVTLFVLAGQRARTNIWSDQTSSPIPPNHSVTLNPEVDNVSLESARANVLANNLQHRISMSFC